MARSLQFLVLGITGLAAAKTTCSEKATSATPTPQLSCTTSSNFRLVADVISGDLAPSIQDWAVSSYHIGACYDYAILQPNDGSSPDYSRAFYVNGTAADARDKTSDIITDGATPPVPYGVIIPSANETDQDDRRPVQINCGYGTAGVVVSRGSSMKPHLRYVDKTADTRFGGWYACDSDLPYGPAVVLYYRDREEAIPEECAELTLYTQCIEHVSTVDDNARPAPCEEIIEDED
ncbi:uncharacterized protein LTR77_010871 [Saxophila tyrrhenica]|uniref:DUF7907 domain-containing protein n=1 Tax=Saxophila tyrrhenica TaxID=1690608 RepID=A0AAV9NX12_9PEZI|nr:hypothetical protein LTR77_010871 [Saxophila tyrrhenica]